MQPRLNQSNQKVTPSIIIRRGRNVFNLFDSTCTNFDRNVLCSKKKKKKNALKHF